MALRGFKNFLGPTAGVSLRTNMSDPRYQQALLAERASRPQAAIRNIGGASAAAAGQDLDTRLAFARVGLQRKMAQADEKYNMRQLSMQKQQLQDAANTFKWQTALGIGTGLFGIGEKMWMRGERDKTLALQAGKDAETRAWRNKMLALAERGYKPALFGVGPGL